MELEEIATRDEDTHPLRLADTMRFNNLSSYDPGSVAEPRRPSKQSHSSTSRRAVLSTLAMARSITIWSTSYEGVEASPFAAARTTVMRLGSTICKLRATLSTETTAAMRLSF